MGTRTKSERTDDTRTERGHTQIKRGGVTNIHPKNGLPWSKDHTGDRFLGAVCIVGAVRESVAR